MMSRYEHRGYIAMTAEDRLKFKALGGSRWLREVLAATPEPEIRAPCAVPLDERAVIAAKVGRAKVIAYEHRVSEHFVYFVRRCARDGTLPVP